MESLLFEMIAAGFVLLTLALASGFATRYRECCAQDEQSGSMGRKGLRIDVQLRDTFTGREWWLDATCVHPTCASRLASELVSATARLTPNQTTPHHGATVLAQACSVRANARHRCQAAPGRQAPGGPDLPRRSCHHPR